ncbi:MAG: CHAT domain-containing protein [Roseiflexaceae bacterium]|nr:CHAT domain-containing protein [Roseiflexus sp.]MDW8214086.1 CHAT domain-containing protein [Roseiflexaceae bacterium]
MLYYNNHTMKSYSDFEIAVTATESGRFLLKARGPRGEEGDGELRPPDSDPQVQTLLTRLRALDLDEAGIVALGRALFDALFAGAVRDVYVRCRGALGSDEGLRLRLNIPPSATSVAMLPWEFLYDPDRGPLALLDTPVVRHLPQPDRIPPLTAPLPLRVLLTAAQTPPPTAVERELAAVQTALERFGNQVSTTVEPHLTVDTLQNRLREGCHIWHFVGHGGFAADGATACLLFEDDLGDPEPISALQLSIMLDRSNLRLVVLDACATGQLSLDPMRSIAPALVRAQIPAVIAMQSPVSEEATRAFAGAFYRALADAFPIDFCVTEGRRAVMNIVGLGRADWGIPVIYTRTEDGRLFEPRATHTPSTVAEVTARSVGTGIQALEALIETGSDVREAVIAFRADFQAAAHQIDILADYKDVHDHLHSLQFHCYNPIVIDMRRLPDDDLAWESIATYEVALQGILRDLDQVTERNRLPASELSWVADVRAAQADIAQAIEVSDPKLLRKAIRLLNRVLTTQPTLINARLNTAARALRLTSLVQGMSAVRDWLSNAGYDAARISQIEIGVTALATLSASLVSLVDEHDRWQIIDLDLRRIEQFIDQDMTELELSWPKVCERLAPFFLESAESWGAALKQDADKVTSALEAADLTRARQFFHRFRRQAGERFFRVDIELKRVCDELRKVGEPLASVLRMLTP